MNRTILNKVRCMLNQSGLAKSFWAEAAATVCVLINLSPCAAIDFKVPNEMWSGVKPTYNHLRTFGCICYVHTNQGKLNPRAKKAAFLGYPQGIKGYSVWLVDEKKCVISKDIIFNEH
ncbi:Ribonuclease H-like domain containing protein, partial [Trema orientale]